MKLSNSIQKALNDNKDGVLLLILAGLFILSRWFSVEAVGEFVRFVFFLAASMFALHTYGERVYNFLTGGNDGYHKEPTPVDAEGEDGQGASRSGGGSDPTG